MNIEQKKAILSYIKTKDPEQTIVEAISPSADYLSGSIAYNTDQIVVHRKITLLTSEEYVRAYFVVRLVKELGYTEKQVIELEKDYSIGRPAKKAARIDVLVRYPQNWAAKAKRGQAFLFIECKAPDKFDSDRDFIKGQLFNLAKQELPAPEFGVYYTTLSDSLNLLDRALIINLADYPSWEKWDNSGQAANSILPIRYGVPKNIEYANVPIASSIQRPLRTDVTRAEFDRLRKVLHDVIWGGGGTNNNDVFVILIRLFLCRVYDELEASPSARYRFQREAYENGEVESPAAVQKKMSELFKEAARTYLGYSDSDLDETAPFESKKVSAAKVAFVVEQLQGISLTRNTHRGEGDLLGDFFEGIVSQDFTQTKGQFFTHINLVQFCIELSGFSEKVETTFLTERDTQGRPRIPKIIDPSSGSGTFIVEAMKSGTSALRAIQQNGLLPRKLREYATIWFGADSPNSWAREFIYGIEPNSDLGLATKVNMILHGDGSTNVFVDTGLADFKQYALKDRSHGLAVTKRKALGFPYIKEVNEEFDFIFTNPPFSISLSPDEKRYLDNSFTLNSQSASEHLFVERWYQLLKAGGRAIAIIPETILDSSSSIEIRKFVLQYFNVIAVVSLPYIAFKPFTSTKTCIIQIEKKTDDEAAAWARNWHESEREFATLTKELKSKSDATQIRAARRLLAYSVEADLVSRADVLARFQVELEHVQKDGDSWSLNRTIETLGVGDREIFLAEPRNVGYKRRKGLPDLLQVNDLVTEGKNDSVLSQYRTNTVASLQYGFRVRLSDLGVRPGMRMDPKFLHLWVKRSGRIFQSTSQENVAMRELLVPYTPTKLAKGSLEAPRGLVDLANVEARMSIVDGVQEVDEIGSDKIEFGDAVIAISKLEPYLGKVLTIDATKQWIGSPEWLTYTLSPRVSEIDYLRFLLLTPEMLEVYRCLQSGKRHARMSEADFLSLRVPIASDSEQKRLAAVCKGKLRDIQAKRTEIQALRSDIDTAIGGSIQQQPRALANPAGRKIPDAEA